jgi:hypothetical protein
MENNMRKMFSIFLLLLSINLFGQDKSLEIVYKLFELTNTQLIMNQMIDEVIGVQVRTNPNLAVYQDIMKDFLNKRLDYELLKEEMAKIYTNEFSDSELQELVEFYKTDIGKKTVQKMPLILQKSMSLGERAVSTYLPELQKMIREKQKKLIAEEFESTAFGNYYSYDSTYTLSVPENWDRNIQLLNGSTFQAGDPINEMYLLVLSEQLPDSNEYNLTYETNEFVNNFAATVDNFNILDSSKAVINDHEQHKVSFNCVSDGLELTYFLVGVKGDKNAYLIVSWTLTELYSANRLYFEKATNTFKEES